MNVGMMIFYDNITGEVIVNTGEYKDAAIKKTIEQQIATYTELSERNRDTFDVLELEYGQYYSEFRDCNGYRVNVETKTLEFSHPDPNEPEAPKVFTKPLTEQIAEVKAENESLNLAVIDIYEIILG